MFVINVLYPSGYGLDMDYYRDRHLPLVRRLLEPMGMRSLTYYRPADSDPEAAYQLIAHLTFDDAETAQTALAAHGPETQADIPSFTSAPPVIAMGEAHAG